MNFFTSVKRKKDFNVEGSLTINKIEFFNIINNIISNKSVQEMKNYRQHCNISCYKHCIYVAYFTYVVCKKLKLDYISATRAAMLHDLFLYDWRKKNRNIDLPGLHAFVHPKIALKNSLNFFDLNKKEQDIILKHMWPLTIRFPRYFESFIVTLVDKYCATKEFFEFFKYKKNLKKIFKLNKLSKEKQK